MSPRLNHTELASCSVRFSIIDVNGP